MTRSFAPGLFAFALSAAVAGLASIAAADPAPSLAGRWVVDADFFGTSQYFTLQLTQQGETLAGEFSRDKLEGAVRGGAIHFLAKDGDGGSEEGTATLTGGAMTGSILFTTPENPEHPVSHRFTAALVPPPRPRTPRRHDFAPTAFYRQFSPHNRPVLTIAPGDTVATSTVDAGGNDAKGIPRVLGGNPQTGPFNDLVEGTTLYLGVHNPGALLYLGDATPRRAMAS